MGAMQAKISSPEALERFAKRGYYPVTSAWFSGDDGAGKTNYVVRPTDEEYVVTAKNDARVKVRRRVTVKTPLWATDLPAKPSSPATGRDFGVQPPAQRTGGPSGSSSTKNQPCSTELQMQPQRWNSAL
jgi:hypothetical protein